MSISAINEQLLRAVGVGIALFDDRRLSVQFTNDVFVDWFSDADADATLSGLFPDLDVAAMRENVAATGRYTHELSFRRKRRTFIVAQVFTRAIIGDQTLYVLECQNITRIRELESMIASYSTMVERNTRELQREKEQVERLLLNVMPRAAYEEYKNFGVVAPKRYDEASVMVLDFVGFSETLLDLPPATFVSELNELYTSFDQIGEQFGCERIKTTGDTYLCIAGLQGERDDHLGAVAKSALRFVRYLKKRNEAAETKWRCRIGIGTGPVIGSVVGVQKYVYDVFGPAVDRATDALRHAAPMEALIQKKTAASRLDAVETTLPMRAEALSADLTALAAL